MSKTKRTNLSLNEVKMILRVVPLVCGIAAITWGMITVINLRATFQLTRFDELFPKTVYINNESELVSIKRKNMNTTYILMNDLTFDGGPDLYDQGIEFTGTFEGNGHTISIKGTGLNSFFYKIGKKGVVKDLKLNYINNVEPGEKNFGGVATINEGKIQNVFINFNSDITLKEHEFVGGIAAINSGEISTSFVIVNFKESEKYVRNYSYGGLVGNSIGGSITRNVTIVSSDYVTIHHNDIIDGLVSAPKVAYAVASLAKSSNISSIYTYDNHEQFIDRANSYITLKTEDGLKESTLYTSATYGLIFPTNIWNCENNSFPTLKPNSVVTKGGE